MNIERNELKYYIGVNEYLNLSRILKKILISDPHNSIGRGYFIRSLYFDNLNDKSFEEKMSGVEKRKKYRLRLYDVNSKNVKFEVKNKINNNILKESAWISKDDAIEIQNKNYDILLKYKNRLLNKIYCEFKKDAFSPIILVDYLREAYIYDLNNIRITFDRFLKSNSVNLDIFNDDIFTKSVIKDELIILEIKYNGFIPRWIKKILQLSRFERSAISKYCLSTGDVIKHLSKSCKTPSS